MIEDKGLDLSVTDNDGDNVLLFAGRSGNLEVLKYLIEDKGLDLSFTNNYVINVLLFTVRRIGNLEVLRYFVEDKGLDLSFTDDYGNNALLLAARSGNLEVLRYLVEDKGLDLRVTDNDGDNVLSLAAGNNQLKVLEYLMRFEEIVLLSNFDYICNHFANVKKIKECILENVKREKIIVLDMLYACYNKQKDSLLATMPIEIMYEIISKLEYGKYPYALINGKKNSGPMYRQYIIKFEKLINLINSKSIYDKLLLISECLDDNSNIALSSAVKSTGVKAWNNLVEKQNLNSNSICIKTDNLPEIMTLSQI